MSQKTERAIESLYEAFGKGPKPHSINGCPCCLDHKDICTLLSTPLRSLTGEELSPYASSVFLTVGGETDFLYFLPRILEISATDASWWPDPEVVLGKLRYAGWENWPSDQRRAVLAFIDAVLSDSISDPDSDLDSWICAIAHCVDDMAPYLKRVSGSTAAFVRLYEANSQRLTKGKLSNAFWEDAPAAASQVIEWFKSSEIQRAIRDYYEGASK